MLFFDQHYGWRGLSENPRRATDLEKHPFTSSNFFIVRQYGKSIMEMVV